MTSAFARNPNAPTPSSAVPAVGAANKRRLPVEPTNTDAYSQAQFAKPGIPKTHWNANDQAKRASGELPTKCAAMQMTVSVTDTGLRCYRISITGWKTIVVVHQVDTDAETLLRAVVPTLDTLPTREVVVFEPLCDVTFKPVTQFGRTRLMLLSIAQREAPKKPVESPKETKPVNAEKTSELDEVFPRDANNQPADAKTARNYGRLWQRMNELYSFYAMPDHMDLDQHEHIHVLLGLRRDGSLLDLGAMEDNVIYKNLKTALDVGFKLKTFAATVKAQSDTKAIETHAVDAASVPVPGTCVYLVKGDQIEGDFKINVTAPANLRNNPLRAFIADDARKQIGPAFCAVRTFYNAETGDSGFDNDASATPVPETHANAPAGKVEPQSGQATAYPNYPESPVVVYPMQNGGVVYKSIRFSVTMRLGGTWAMALVLMDDFAAHREFIDPSCIVHAPIASTGGATAPAVPMLPMTPAAPAGGVPDSKGRIPGQTGADAIAYVCRSVVNGAETIELWQATGKWPEHKMRRDNEKAMLISVGINYTAMDAGTKYPCKLSAAWVTTANKSEKDGKFTYYRDVTAITQVA